MRWKKFRSLDKDKLGQNVEKGGKRKTAVKTDLEREGCNLEKCLMIEGDSACQIYLNQVRQNEDKNKRMFSTHQFAWAYTGIRMFERMKMRMYVENGFKQFWTTTENYTNKKTSTEKTI